MAFQARNDVSSEQREVENCGVVYIFIYQLIEKLVCNSGQRNSCK